MTAVRAQKIYATCTGKIAYESAFRAYETVRRQEKRGYAVKAYRCKQCSKWHVGRAR